MSGCAPIAARPKTTTTINKKTKLATFLKLPAIRRQFISPVEIFGAIAPVCGIHARIVPDIRSGDRGMPKTPPEGSHGT